MAIQFLTPLSAGQVKRLAEDSDYKKTSPNKKFEVKVTISGETRTFTLDHLSNANSAIASALAKLAKEKKEANVGRFIAINRKNATAKELTASSSPPTNETQWSGTYNHNGLDYSIAFVGTQEVADAHAANLNLKDVAPLVELSPHLSISALFLADQVFASSASSVSSPVTSAIKVNKPYKPRKLKNDPYHALMRRARKLKRPNPSAKAKSARTRKLWLQRNKQALKRRSEFVRKAKQKLAPTVSK